MSEEYDRTLVACSEIAEIVDMLISDYLTFD